MIAKLPNGRHRLHLMMQGDSASFQANERATQLTKTTRTLGSVTEGHFDQNADHQYRSQHEHRTYFGLVAIEKDIHHIDSSFQDTAECAARIRASTKEDTVCCAGCSKCCSISCYLNCFLCFDCKKCFGDECCGTTSELLDYHWSAKTKFEADLDGALRQYEERVGEKEINSASYEVEGFKSFAEPGIMRVATLSKALHSIYMVYRTSAHNTILLGQCVRPQRKSALSPSTYTTPCDNPVCWTPENSCDAEHVVRLEPFLLCTMVS